MWGGRLLRGGTSARPRRISGLEGQPTDSASTRAPPALKLELPCARTAPTRRGRDVRSFRANSALHLGSPPPLSSLGQIRGVEGLPLALRFSYATTSHSAGVIPRRLGLASSARRPRGVGEGGHPVPRRRLEPSLLERRELIHVVRAALAEEGTSSACCLRNTWSTPFPVASMLRAVAVWV